MNLIFASFLSCTLRGTTERAYLKRQGEVLQRSWKMVVGGGVALVAGAGPGIGDQIFFISFADKAW